MVEGHAIQKPKPPRNSMEFSEGKKTVSSDTSSDVQDKVSTGSYGSTHQETDITQHCSETVVAECYEMPNDYHDSAISDEHDVFTDFAEKETLWTDKKITTQGPENIFQTYYNSQCESPKNTALIRQSSLPSRLLEHPLVQSINTNIQSPRQPTTPELKRQPTTAVKYLPSSPRKDSRNDEILDQQNSVGEAGQRREEECNMSRTLAKSLKSPLLPGKHLTDAKLENKIPKMHTDKKIIGKKGICEDGSSSIEHRSSETNAQQSKMKRVESVTDSPSKSKFTKVSADTLSKPRKTFSRVRHHRKDRNYPISVVSSPVMPATASREYDLIKSTFYRDMSAYTDSVASDAIDCIHSPCCKCSETPSPQSMQTSFSSQSGKEDRALSPTVSEGSNIQSPVHTVPVCKSPGLFSQESPPSKIKSASCSQKAVSNPMSCLRHTVGRGNLLIPCKYGVPTGDSASCWNPWIQSKSVCHLMRVTKANKKSRVPSRGPKRTSPLPPKLPHQYSGPKSKWQLATGSTMKVPTMNTTSKASTASAKVPPSTRNVPETGIVAPIPSPENSGADTSLQDCICVFNDELVKTKSTQHHVLLKCSDSRMLKSVAHRNIPFVMLPSVQVPVVAQSLSHLKNTKAFITIRNSTSAACDMSANSTSKCDERV